MKDHPRTRSLVALLAALVAGCVAGCVAGAPSRLANARVRPAEPARFAARQWRTVPPAPAEFPPPASSLAFSRDGRLLAIGYDDGHPARLYDCAAGSQLEPPGGAASGDPVSFSPDGSLLALGADGVKAWDLQTGRKVIDVDEPVDTAFAFESINHFAFSPDGRLLATATMRFRLLTLIVGPRGEAHVRDLSSKKQVLHYVAHEGPVQCVAFSPDGKRLAFGSGARLSVHGLLFPAARGCKLRVVDLERGKVRFTAGLSHFAASVAFSPGGRTVAAADERGGVGLWDAATGRLERALRRPSDPLLGANVTFSPDGRWVAAAAGDRTYVWDAQTGAEQADAIPTSSATAVAFSPDGQLLAIADRQGEVTVWQVTAATAGPRPGSD